MNRGTSRRRGIALDDWIKLMAVLGLVLGIVSTFVQAGLAEKMGVELEGGARLGGIGCGVVFTFLIAWLGVTAVERGWRIIAWIIAILFTLNTAIAALIIIAMLAVSDKQLQAAGTTDLAQGTAAQTTPADNALASGAAPQPSTRASQPTPSSAAAPSASMPAQPQSALTTPARPTQPISSVDTASAIAADAKFEEGRAMFRRIADEAAPELRGLARAFAQPPQPDRKAIEDRKAMALAVQANTSKLRTNIQSIGQTIIAKSKDSNLTQEQTSVLLVAFNRALDLPRRTLAAEEMHEITVLAIRECDLLLANLGSWRIEGNKIVGKDDEQTTQLNDPRFFLRAKLNQLETRLTQLRGG